MRLFVITILFSIWPLVALAGGFTIGEFRKYGPENYLELYRHSQGGENFEHILNLVDPSHENFSIRILSPLTNESKEEIKKYYEKNLPNELKKALNSKGNLHNPAIQPLVEKFIPALKTTILFRNFESLISQKGYKVIKIEFEKFWLDNNQVFVAEITIICKKIA